MNTRTGTYRGRLAALFLICLAAAPSVGAQWLKDQAVTYSDFGWVRSVTNSQRLVYFATTNGVLVYDKIRGQWEAPMTGAEGLAAADMVNIRTDRFGNRLLASTGTEVFEYNKLFGRWAPLVAPAQLDAEERHIMPPANLIPDRGGNSFGGGRFVDWRGYTCHTTDVVDDKAGTLWVGTWGLGPAMASDVNGMMTFLPYGLLQDHVAAILADDSLRWFGGPMSQSFRTGITAFNPEQNTFFQIESGLTRSFPAYDINCLAADRQRLYVGTAHGVFPMDRGTWECDPPLNQRRGLEDENIRSLAVMDKALLIGTDRGLYWSDLATDSLYTVYANTFAGQVIYDLAPIDSTVWIASSVGAYRYSPKANTLQRYQDSGLVLFSEVYNIEHNGDDTWFVSNNGLVRLNRATGASTPYREASTHTEGRALAVNDRIAAVASDNGVTLIFLDREKPLSKEFGENDGIVSNTVLSLLLDGPNLWIGTDKGVTRFLWDNPQRVD